MPQSMPNAARQAGRLFAQPLVDRRCPISARIWRMCEGPNARLASRSLFASFFTSLSSAAAYLRASIFESNALTTSTFDSNT